MALPKFPRGIYIVGKLWIVKLAILKHEYGTCNDPPPVITIDRKQSIENQRDALVHEITHAIDFDLGLKLKEEQVGRLATAWLSTLRANPNLTKFLLAD